MKKTLMASFISVAVAWSSTAADFTYPLQNLNRPIPDGDLSGIQSSQTIGGIAGPISRVTLSLDISDGYNGDLYAYLWHNNSLAVLLNRVGRTGSNSTGYLDHGFGYGGALNQFVFDDQAANDVHFYRTVSYTLSGSGQLTGLWQPDGRSIDPLSSGSVFESASRSSNLAVFNGMDPNGLWLLYIADVSPGGESMLNAWDLQITIVPEPSAAALILTGLLLSRFRRRNGV